MKRRDLLKYVAGLPLLAFLPKVALAQPSKVRELFSRAQLQEAYDECCEKWPTPPDKLVVGPELYENLLAQAKAGKHRPTRPVECWDNVEKHGVHYIKQHYTGFEGLFIWVNTDSGYQRGLRVEELVESIITVSPSWASLALNVPGPEGSGSGDYYGHSLSRVRQVSR